MENSMKVTVNIGIGTITLDLDGAENTDILISLREELLNALDTTNFDIQEVETIINGEKQ
jgi:hypothetical protein